VHLEASLRRRDRRGSDTPSHEFESVLSDCVRELGEGGAQGALVRFSPLSWRRRGVPFELQAEALGAVAQRAVGAWGMFVRWFVTLKREDTPCEWEEAVDAGIRARSAGVAGVDVSRSYLVSDRGDSPPPHGNRRELGAAVVRAREAGLVVAVHCGWYDGRRELEEALGWGASRIGHGTPLGEAPDLLNDLARRKVVVEVCPTAYEWRTRRPLARLPIGEWLSAGIAVDVGTDHPRALETDLRTEALKLGGSFPTWPEIALRKVPSL
jgi:aminodeoxyfutalosine deaminase